MGLLLLLLLPAAAAVKGTSLVPFSKIAFFHVGGHKFRIAEDTIKTANGGNSRRSTPVDVH